MKSPLLILSLALLSFSTLAAEPFGIPNYVGVDKSKNIQRGGQPNAWALRYLPTVGISNIVKLNGGKESAPGMTVHSVPISTWQQVFGGKKLAANVEAAELVITPGTLIHCTHGQDRTGLIIAVYRVRHGWSKADAEKEMLAMGFHKSLFGLWAYWKHVQEPMRTPPLPTPSAPKQRAKAVIVAPPKQYKLAWDYDQELVASGAIAFEIWKSNDLSLGVAGFELWQIATTNECAIGELESQAFFICRAVDENRQVSEWNK